MTAKKKPAPEQTIEWADSVGRERAEALREIRREEFQRRIQPAIDEAEAYWKSLVYNRDTGLPAA
jgi:hypothetical protein